MTEPILLVDDVSKRYRADGPWANRNVSMKVRPGTMCCVLGANGAGKTTLVRQIMGRVDPDEGAVRISGVDVRSDRVWPTRVCGYLPQEPLPFRTMTVERALLACASLKGVPWRERREVVFRALEHWDLVAKASARIGRLSGGERRLAGLAAATFLDYPLFVLDEPTNELDPGHRRKVWELLRDRRAQGAAVLVITHNVHEAEAVADSVIILAGGQVVAAGTIADLQRAAGSTPRTVELGASAVDSVAGHWGFVLDGSTQRARALVGPDDLRGLLHEISTACPDELAGLAVRQPSLEDLFHSFADRGRSVPDAEGGLDVLAR